MLTGMPLIVEEGDRAKYRQLVKANPMKMQAPDERSEWKRAILSRLEQVELWQQQDPERLAVDANEPNEGQARWVGRCEQQ